MKRIIKHGLFDDPIHTKVCPSCKCVFEYDADEVDWEQLYGDDKMTEIVRCPQCGNMLRHEA